MYFIEDIPKLPMVEELRYLYRYHIECAIRYPVSYTNHKARADECMQLIEEFYRGYLSFELMEKMKEKATQAREIRLGKMNRPLLKQRFEVEVE